MITSTDLPNLFTWPTRISRSNIVVAVQVPGDPISKQRPRFTRSHRGVRTYTPQKTSEAEFELQLMMREQNPNLFPDDTSAFGVRAFFAQKTRQRRDIDNMTKLILDAANGLIWKDDTQVVELFAGKVNEYPEPHTDFIIYKLGSEFSPTQKCAICNKRFKTYPSWGARIYCSKRCSSLAQTTRTTVPCATCGTELERIPTRQKAQHQFCNVECKATFGHRECVCAHCQKPFTRPQSLLRTGKTYCSEDCLQADVAQRGPKTPKGTCLECGNGTSKKTYTRCRACVVKAKKFRNPEGAKAQQ